MFFLVFGVLARYTLDSSNMELQVNLFGLLPQWSNFNFFIGWFSPEKDKETKQFFVFTT